MSDGLKSVGIVSFDVSSVSSGWCNLVDGNIYKFGVVQPPKKFSVSQKLYFFDNVIRDILVMSNPQYVIVEDTYLKNVKTLKTLMQFIGVVNLECINVLKREVIFISTMKVRSSFGLRSKDQVFEFVKDLYKPMLDSYVFKDGNDITDSILQALYYYKFVL